MRWLSIRPSRPPSTRASRSVSNDSGGDNEGVTYIGTDNAVGAALAGQYLCDNVPAGGKVAILQGLITTTTGQARAEGSKAAVTECGLDLVMDRRPRTGTAPRA